MANRNAPLGIARTGYRLLDLMPHEEKAERGAPVHGWLISNLPRRQKYRCQFANRGFATSRGAHLADSSSF